MIKQNEDLWDALTKDPKDTNKEHGEMLTFYKEDVKEIIIECEATIATGQFENLKPRIIMKLDKEIARCHVEQAFNECRKILGNQYRSIKGVKQ